MEDRYIPWLKDEVHDIASFLVSGEISVRVGACPEYVELIDAIIHQLCQGGEVAPFNHLHAAILRAAGINGQPEREHVHRAQGPVRTILASKIE